MKPPVVATLRALEEGNDLQSPIPGNQILGTSLIQIGGLQSPKSNNLIFEVSLICPMA
jgi:hypothetical protein